jgi:hypothetical protein
MTPKALMPESVESLIEYCRDRGRVCPLPMPWHRLVELLANSEHVTGRPPVPLILAAWSTPALGKMLRLEEQIQWAERRGLLEDAATFLRTLREEDWYHGGE